MYRDHENIMMLEKRLEAAQQTYTDFSSDCLTWAPDNPKWDRLAELHQDIEELKQRLNFAWQDAYEEDY